MKKVAYIITGIDIRYGMDCHTEDKVIEEVYIGSPGLNIESIKKEYNMILNKFHKECNEEAKRIKKDPVLLAKHAESCQKMNNETFKPEVWFYKNWRLEKVDFIEYENE